MTVKYNLGCVNDARQEMCAPAATEQLAVRRGNVREEASVISPAGCLGMR